MSVEKSLERYLHESIPLTRAMAVSVLTIAADEVTLQALLAPNVNLHSTAFGGSVASLATLAAWSLLYTRLQAAGVDADLVIQRGSTEYLLPVTGDFSARSRLEQPEKWPLFLQMLSRKGKARAAVLATVEQGGREAAHFSGEFVATVR